MALTRPKDRWAWWRPVWGFAALLVAYYAFPVDNAAEEIPELLLTVVGLAVLAWVLRGQAARLTGGAEAASTPALAMLLVLVVMCFSLTFFIVATAAPDQIAGLNTKTDALYFTVATMATVGYGDVHAVGQFARILAVILMIFNIVVVAALARALTARRKADSDSSDSGSDADADAE